MRTNDIQEDLLQHLRSEVSTLFSEIEEGHSVRPSLLVSYVIEKNSQDLQLINVAEVLPTLERFVEVLIEKHYPSN